MGNFLPKERIRIRSCYASTAHSTYSYNIKLQKGLGMGLNGFIFIFQKINESKNLNTKKSLEVAC